ncbi:DUF427 domain-containing protein [Maribacter sp. 1_2014MBL_MicDiv]|uniref:DUF427 domain-containing protein n=1 Tax=Maribacter sp. 1_2014MBL_MicDiv TaxID=1644130 RepID=UPI0008F4D95F|nr:DUF427 domain-containing protein [Maribacter sp. 1_2014MBL_MicDiv]APA64762.1 hypothetical protein YQ22_10795 [Maribacter sp. 1_2014MBL_MicDiv]
MVKAIWNNTVIAESDATVQVEGNHYFPPSAIKKEYFKTTDTHTSCPWKGVASYYDIEVDGDVNKDSAWYYPEVSELAKGIKGYIAFWKGVEVK